MAVDDDVAGEDEMTVRMEDAGRTAGGEVAEFAAMEHVVAADRRVDAGQRAEAALDRRRVQGDAIAVGAAAAFDRQGEDVGFADREAGGDVGGHQCRIALDHGAVEEAERGVDVGDDAEKFDRGADFALADQSVFSDSVSPRSGPALRILSGGQTARPRVVKRPLRSKETTAVCSAGGWPPFVEPNSARPSKSIGAKVCRGSFWGEKPASARRTRSPTWTSAAFADAAKTAIKAAPAIRSAARAIRSLLNMRLLTESSRISQLCQLPRPPNLDSCP